MATTGSIPPAASPPLMGRERVNGLPFGVVRRKRCSPTAHHSMKETVNTGWNAAGGGKQVEPLRVASCSGEAVELPCYKVCKGRAFPACIGFHQPVVGRDVRAWQVLPKEASIALPDNLIDQGLRCKGVDRKSHGLLGGRKNPRVARANWDLGACRKFCRNP